MLFRSACFRVGAIICLGSSTGILVLEPPYTQHEENPTPRKEESQEARTAWAVAASGASKRPLSFQPGFPFRV